jgi:hypothetical protein
VDETKKPEMCGRCPVPIGKTTSDNPVCGFAVMDLCFDNCCAQCRVAIKHSCGWVDPAEIRAALLPYLEGWAKDGMIGALDPVHIHGELLAAGIITDAIEIHKRVFDKARVWIGVFFPKNMAWMVQLGVYQATGTPDDEATWATSKAWYGLRDIRVRRPATKVPADVARFWTGVEPLAWDILQA